MSVPINQEWHRMAEDIATLREAVSNIQKRLDDALALRDELSKLKDRVLICETRQDQLATTVANDKIEMEKAQRNRMAWLGAFMAIIGVVVEAVKIALHR